MKIFVLFMVIFIVNSGSADCGCLKCSKHLQGIDIQGPNGCPIKVVFKRPKLCDNCFSGGSYTPQIQAPLIESTPPAAPILRHHNYQIQYCPKKFYQIVDDCGGQVYSAQLQVPETTYLTKTPPPLINNLKYRVDTILVPTPKCGEVNSYYSSDIQGDSSTTLTSGFRCCSDRSELDYFLSNFIVNDQDISCKCGKRSKRSVHTVNKSRNKRDLAKSGYNFLMGLLPQFLRDPLHHSIQGTYVPPKPSLRDKLDEFKLKSLISKLKSNRYDYEEPQSSYLLSKNYGQKLNNILEPDFNEYQPKYSLGLNKYSKLFKSAKQPSISLNSGLFEDQDQLYNTKYRYEPSPLSKLSLRAKGLTKNADEASLLRKLKKLNHNPYSSDIENQANNFMQDLLRPDDHKRPKRTAEDLKRHKRTIILSSNEIDLPPHYEVDFVSVEDDELESALGNLENFQEDPIVGSNNHFLRKLTPSSKKLVPFIPKLQKPEVLIGKNVIKQAVRDELNAYHKKVEQEQKIKEIKTNMERRKQQASIIPHNPIFMLLTAPMKFLKHFHDINKGVNPVMTSLPKLVYTTKKYFRDFGKNFQKNCLNLASDIIGDFDHVPPQVVQRITLNDDGERFKRNVVSEDVITYTENRNKIIKEKEVPVKLALKPERDSEKTFMADVNEINHFQVTLQPNKTLQEIGSTTETGQKKATTTHNSLTEKRNFSLFNTFFHMVKDFLDANLSLTESNENGSKTKHVQLKENNETENIRVKVDTKIERKFGKSEKPIEDDRKNSSHLNYKKFNEIASQNSKDAIALGKFESSTKTNLKALTTNNENNEAAKVKATNIEKDESLTIKDYLSSNGEETVKVSPYYSFAIKNSKETQNFRLISEAHVRKKRYVVKVVDDSELQDQVETYLTQKMDDKFSYLKPLQAYYNRANAFLTKLNSGSKNFDATDEDEMSYEEDLPPKRKVLQIKKVKPRIIIDNKGLPFMEFDGFKRPLLLKSKFVEKQETEKSSEETGNKIATLIARAKEDSEVVGASHRDIIPAQIIKERISLLLEEIDQLIHLNAENYDEIFEDLIKIQNIKTSIEQDWKRILINNKVDDINVKISLLSKFKDLQQTKDDSVKNIAKALEKNDNEFVRCQLVNSLIKLQKLQSLITSVVEDFEQHLKTKTSFNTKKEIKFVDFLSELNFVYANTRNDMVENLYGDRDVEGQKNIELLHKFKKLLATSDSDSEIFQQAAKLAWEMKHMEKLQKQTIVDMNKKLAKKFKIKKELKILFDLQRGFEDCVTKLNHLLGNLAIRNSAIKFGQKKDINSIVAEMKHKHNELLEKIKIKNNRFKKMKKS